MKTKNLICGSLFLMTVCSSAFAVSADNRQTFCESHPDKYVWVEKTEACIPINPCGSNNSSIRDSYCVEAPIMMHEKMVEKYVKYHFNSGIASSKTINNYGKKAYYLTDGNYIVFDYQKGFVGEGSQNATEEFIMGAFWVYDAEKTVERLDDRMMYSKTINSEEICSEVADLTTISNGSICTYDYGNSTCVIKCDEFDRSASVFTDFSGD